MLTITEAQLDKPQACSGVLPERDEAESHDHELCNVRCVCADCSSSLGVSPGHQEIWMASVGMLRQRDVTLSCVSWGNRYRKGWKHGDDFVRRSVRF